MNGVTSGHFDESILKDFDVVPVSPIGDPFLLTGTVVTAESAYLALNYLLEAGSWRDLADQDSLRRRYQMVERRSSAPVFHGTKAEWIQAVQLGYMPRPVRFSAMALTQHRVDKKREQDSEKHRQLVWELTRPNLYESLRYWYRQQRFHPLRWKIIGMLTAGFAFSMFWNQVWTSALGLFILYRIFRWARGH